MPTSTNERRATDSPGPTGDVAPRDTPGGVPTPRVAGFRRLLEATQIVPWEADARTRTFTYVGPQAARLLGYPIERWYEPGFWAAHVYPADQERVVGFFEQSAHERDAYEHEYRMVAASGQSVWVHDIVAIDRVDGAPILIRGFLMDVSQRKRAEATARASEARLRQLIEQAPDAIIAVRSEGQVAFVNRQAERMFGYRRSELVGLSFERLVPGQPDVKRLMATQGEGRSHEPGGTGDTAAPITGMCRDGRTFPAEINFSLLETDEGLVIVNTVRDITERLAAETALRQSQERLRIAATLGADIIAEVDIETGDVEWFGQVDEALGFERGEFPRTIDGLAGQLHPEDQERVTAEVEREVVELGRGLSAEFRIGAKGGAYRHWSVRVAPRRDGERRPTKFIAVCSDVTEQIAARAEALRHRDALAHVARVSTLAHELNQPLAAMLSDAQAALRLLDRDPPDVPQIREVLRDIVADDRRASAIIQRLRDMMRRAPAAPERIDLCQVAREVREIMRSGLVTRAITVVPDFAGDLPVVVADRIQIQQVVVNLVTNAMQAMNGMTHARLTLGVKGRDDGWQVVSVTDTGPGIAAQALETMFEPFTSSRSGGLGSRSRAASSSPTAARSGPRTGRPAARPSVSDCRLRGPRVHDDVVVDDDQSVRRSVVRLLETAGLQVEGFVSAEAFLDRERPEGPGCLILDVRMSGMSGLGLQRHLAAAGRPMAVVFITGHGDVPMSVEAMKAGAVDYLLKPFDDEALLAAIDRAVARDRVRLREQQELNGLRARYERLTPRQQQVFAWVATGLLNKQIAAHLGTGEKNIKVHRARVMATMQAGSLADLVRQAERLQLRPTQHR